MGDLAGELTKSFFALRLAYLGKAVDRITELAEVLSMIIRRPEVLSGAVIDGLRFFGFRGYHELNHECGSS
ncbi:hypothetical protein [Streptomyces zhihengii]|uniref:Uncharacterized protein n=1 Tax=Streptomyces zhihengii TaxID=1818004 RepID=A0ABS2V427_9ACTN|nr:hypothetical protein [Streptomyces zhihengii]MBM9624575.1 hypothetical protein [Streptomyces zhihengii]